jgi:hypothetical protein
LRSFQEINNHIPICVSQKIFETLSESEYFVIVFVVGRVPKIQKERFAFPNILF